MSEPWSKENVEQLINLVARFGVLHDTRKVSEYTSREKAWESIGRRMGAGFTGDKCKKKFASLKSAFRAECKNGKVTDEKRQLFSFLPQSSGMGRNNERPARVTRRRRRSSAQSEGSRVSMESLHENADRLTYFFKWCEKETRRFRIPVQTEIKRTFTNIIYNAEKEDNRQNAFEEN